MNRGGTVKMGKRIRSAVVAVCAALLLAWPVYGENRTFTELLERAKEQAAAGHRWDPPGDNMSETVIGMIDLMPTATPAQLTELAQLLKSDPGAAPDRA